MCCLIGRIQRPDRLGDRLHRDAVCSFGKIVQLSGHAGQRCSGLMRRCCVGNEDAALLKHDRIQRIRIGCTVIHGNRFIRKGFRNPFHQCGFSGSRTALQHDSVACPLFVPEIRFKAFGRGAAQKICLLHDILLFRLLPFAV